MGRDSARDSGPPQGRALPRERGILEVGLTLETFQEKLAGELAPAVLQVASDAMDSSPRVAVIWQKKRAGEEVALTLGGEANLAADAGRYADRTALDIGLFHAGPPKGKRDEAAEAIDRLDKQLVQKPDDFGLLRARGMAAANLGRDQQAVEDLTKALEKNAGDVLGRHLLAVSQARLGNSAAATAALEEIAKLAGNQSQAPYSRAVVQAILGKEQEGLAALEEAKVIEHGRLA